MVSVVNSANLPLLAGRNAVAVGVFDGVHAGHRRLISVLAREAKRSGGEAVVLTFERHPSELTAPESAPLYIDTFEKRVKYLKEAGADRVVVVQFDRAFADLSPEQFVKDVLVDRLAARSVVVGPNFRFGKDRVGDVDVLRELATANGCAVLVVPPLLVEGEFVSSTRIRSLIAEGDVHGAADLLGRNFALVGTVVHGEHVGHTIGFPTANVKAEERQLLPAFGVYCAAFTVREKRYELAVVNVGVRPTIGVRSTSVEVHVPGFQGNIYEERVDVEFKRRLRSEQKFDSLDALAEQIKKDIEAARQCCLGMPGPAGCGGQA